MLYLKQSTASQTALIGPFLDSTDGDTEETGLTIANTDIKLSKNGATIASKNSGGGTHDADGFYQITLDATDTATVGKLQLYCHMSGALMVYHEYYVLEEAIYDALFAASSTGFDANQRVNVGQWLSQAVTVSSGNLPDVNIAEISDDATAADNLEADYDGTGFNKSNSVIGTCTTNTDMRGTNSAMLASSYTAPDNSSIADILTDTGTTIPALISIAQADLDTITGGDGATLATNQGAITWSAQTFSASGASANITIDGSGAGDGLVFSRSGSGDLFGPNWSAAIQGEVTGSLNTYDGPTRAELTADKEEMLEGVITGAAAIGTLSTTQATSDLTGYADNQLIGRIITWTSGSCEGEQTDITDYASTGGLMTFTALTTAPSNTDTFKIT